MFKKWIQGVVLLVVAALAVAASVLPSSAAVSSVQISPASQTRASGATASWDWQWSGTGTYVPKLTYGDGGSRTWASQTGGGGGSASHVFWQCNNVNLTQNLTLKTSTGSLVGSATASTNVKKANPC